MNRLWSPMLGHSAAAPGAPVYRHELANDVPVADDQPRRFAAELQILRDEADRRHREDLVAVAHLGPAINHGRRADAAILTDAHVRPDRHVGPDLRPRADDRVGMHDGGRMNRRSCRTPGGARAGEPHEKVRFGHDVVAQVRHAMRPRQVRAPRAHHDLQAQAIARHHLPAELGVVHTAEVCA